MFARNLKNPRTAEPELDKKSLASLGIALASSFKVLLTKTTALFKKVTTLPSIKRAVRKRRDVVSTALAQARFRTVLEMD